MEYFKNLSNINIPFNKQAATALQYFGAASLAYLTFRAWNFSSLFLLPNIPLSRYQRQDRAWALITGSSAGIGHGCALELAARGFNVILLGHLPDELEQARKAIITETPKAEVKTIVLNAAISTSDAIEKSISDISNLPITILVNNVGGVPVKKPTIRDFDTYTPSEIDTLINLNARFMAHVTRHMLPILKANGPSLLINTSSIGKLGFPGVAAYSATKGFVSSLTQALKRESVASKWPIDIIAIVPGDVETPMNHKGLSPGTPTSRQFAKVVMDRVPRAVDRGETEISPWFLHHLTLAIMGMLPERVLMKAVVDEFDNKKRIYAED